MPRFATRELDAVYRVLAAELEGSDITVSLDVVRWSHRIARKEDPEMSISLVPLAPKRCEHFLFDDYPSPKEMLQAVTTVIRKWKKEASNAQGA